eukprot:TRINITY_DN43534_c0_g1_i1.p1 TRINITY_DN43534_c0_g1~~TRINITY_DN43534_c0_g1_i1.p1  ORF type:complete len:189 (-),score=24.21 TRINITY_DN43534_c0_g1_i1:99-665(-)
MMGEQPDEPEAAKKLAQAQQHIQRYLDKSVVWIKARWGGLAVLFALYVLRVVLKQGFYVVTYGLGIYTLNLLINFLSPAVDPDTEDGPVLPTSSGEFRPFTRKLPEFKFWLNATRAVLISLVMTFFDMFDLPVFWPILLAYFILLLILTMKDRVKHMIKHKYIPFSLGKQTYGDLTKGVKAGGAKNDK